MTTTETSAVWKPRPAVFVWLAVWVSLVLASVVFGIGRGSWWLAASQVPQLALAGFYWAQMRRSVLIVDRNEITNKQAFSTTVFPWDDVQDLVIPPELSWSARPIVRTDSCRTIDLAPLLFIGNGIDSVELAVTIAGERDIPVRTSAYRSTLAPPRN